MRKVITSVAALVLAVGLTSVAAMASSGSGSIGCGGGNGANVMCNSQGLGTVTENTAGTAVTGSADVFLTSVSGISPELAALQVFTPDTDQFNFSFANVGLTFSDGGTFSFTDLTEAGVLTVTGTAELGGTPPPNLTGPLSLVLDASAFSFSFDGLSGSGSLNATGNATLDLDPGNVTSMTGNVGLPTVGGSGGSGPGPTPEPGTLLLLGSGLTGLGFIRRRFVRA